MKSGATILSSPELAVANRAHKHRRLRALLALPSLNASSISVCVILISVVQGRLNVALMPLAVLQHDPTHEIVHFDHRDAACRTHQAAHTFTLHIVRGFRAHLSAGGQRTASFVTVKMFQDLGAVLSH